MTLRAVTYICQNCRQGSVFRFLATYVPFARWLLTCRHCRQYRLHVVAKRPLSGGFR